MLANYWQHDNRYYDGSDCFCSGRALSLSRAARLSSRFETRIRRSPVGAADRRRLSRLVARLVWFIFTTSESSTANESAREFQSQTCTMTASVSEARA